MHFQNETSYAPLLSVSCPRISVSPKTPDLTYLLDRLQIHVVIKVKIVQVLQVKMSVIEQNAPSYTKH